MDLKVKEIVCGSKATLALSLDGVVYSLELTTEGDYTSVVSVCGGVHLPLLTFSVNHCA